MELKHRGTRTEGVVSNKPSTSDVNECSYRSLGCDHDAYQRTILDREKLGFCFDLNVRHYVCVSIHTHTPSPIVMKCGIDNIDVLGTKAERCM